MQRQPRNLVNLTLVARRRRHFRFFLAIFLVAEIPQKKRYLNTQECTHFLSTGVVTASSHALWRVLSKTIIRLFSLCWFDTLHVHTSEWDSLFFQNCLLSAGHGHGHAWSDSDYLNRSASLQRFRLEFTRFRADDRIRTTGCVRIRQSPYGIVGDCSDKGGHQYQWLDRFILWEVLARKRVMFMLRMMTYVVSYTLSWNWNGVVRFVSH